VRVFHTSLLFQDTSNSGKQAEVSGESIGKGALMSNGLCSTPLVSPRVVELVGYQIKRISERSSKKALDSDRLRLTFLSIVEFDASCAQGQALRGVELVGARKKRVSESLCKRALHSNAMCWPSLRFSEFDASWTLD
jgi:hypothetical protein